MRHCIYLIPLLMMSCSEKQDDQHIKLTNENARLQHELDSLKGLLSKDNFSSWTFQRNYTTTIHEGDSLLMTYMITNKNFGIDSTIVIDLFEVTGNDTIKLDEGKYITTFYDNGNILFKIKNLKKGSYYIKSSDNHSNNDYHFFYDWKIE